MTIQPKKDGHIYEVVNRIPEGYSVWNIGERMGTDDYVPLCEPAEPDSLCINPSTLKAIMLPQKEVRILRRASAFGIGSLEKARETVGRLKNRQMIDNELCLYANAKTALTIFERLSE